VAAGAAARGGVRRRVIVPESGGRQPGRGGGIGRVGFAGARAAGWRARAGVIQGRGNL